MSQITEIESEGQWEQLLASLPPTTLLVASFHAPWAAPCAQMATVLQTLASEYPVTEPPATRWVSLNAEELSDISEAYDVTAVPFLVLLRNGQVLETVSGSSAVKVRTAIEAHAGAAGAAAPSAPSNDTPNGTSAASEPAAASQQPSEPVDPAKQKEELFKRLADLVKAAPVMLFMKGTPSGPQCGFSRQMVAILRENSVKYGFFNILADDEVRQGLKEFADWPTFPQLWIDGELVGGLDIVSFFIPTSCNEMTWTILTPPTGQGGAFKRPRLPQGIQRRRRGRCGVKRTRACEPPLIHSDFFPGASHTIYRRSRGEQHAWPPHATAVGWGEGVQGNIWTRSYTAD